MWDTEIEKQIINLSGTKSIREIAKETGKSKTAIGLFLKNHKAMPVAVAVPSEVIPSANLEPPMNANAADAFLNSIVPSEAPPAIPSKSGPPATNFINDLINVDTSGFVEMEHIPRPGRAKKEKVPKATSMPIINLPASVPSLAVHVPEVSKGELIAKITINVNTFEPLLGDIIKPDKDSFLASLNKKSAADLESLLKNVEYTRSLHNLTNQASHFFFMGSSFVEMGTQRFLNMNTQGFTHALQAQQDEIKMILREMMMDKVDTFKKVNKPEARLALIVCTTLLGVNTQNTLNAINLAKRPSAPKPVSQKTDTSSAVNTTEKEGTTPPKPKISMVMPSTSEKFSDL